MKLKIFFICITLFLFVQCKKNSVALVSQQPALDLYETYAKKALPSPPNGKKWKIDVGFTDEFNGNKFDTDKWDNQIPTWKGRVPGYFVAENVSVKDTLLQLKNTWLASPIVLGADNYTIGCAAVRSKKSTLIFPIYTEVRMKASDISLSSTFWLVTDTGVKFP